SGEVAAFAASAEQEQVAGNNFCHVALLVGLLVVPGAGLQASFDIDFTAFLQVLAGNFCEPLPEHDVVPLSAIGPLAVFIFETLVGGKRELRHRREIGRAHVLTPVTWPSRMPSSA